MILRMPTLQTTALNRPNCAQLRRSSGILSSGRLRNFLVGYVARPLAAPFTLTLALSHRGRGDFPLPCLWMDVPSS